MSSLKNISDSKRKRYMPHRLAECVVESTVGDHESDFDDMITYFRQLYFQRIDNYTAEL